MIIMAFLLGMVLGLEEQDFLWKIVFNKIMGGILSFL